MTKRSLPLAERLCTEELRSVSDTAEGMGFEVKSFHFQNGLPESGWTQCVMRDLKSGQEVQIAIDCRNGTVNLFHLEPGGHNVIDKSEVPTLLSAIA